MNKLANSTTIASDFAYFFSFIELTMAKDANIMDIIENVITLKAIPFAHMNNQPSDSCFPEIAIAMVEIKQINAKTKKTKAVLAKG